MLTTYHGLLTGDRIEWDEDAPKNLPSDRPIRVHVTILEHAEAQNSDLQRTQLAEILEGLAALNSTTIADPLAWEREMREDRELPGRDVQ